MTMETKKKKIYADVLICEVTYLKDAGILTFLCVAASILSCHALATAPRAANITTDRATVCRQ